MGKRNMVVASKLVLKLTQAPTAMPKTLTCFLSHSFFDLVFKSIGILRNSDTKQLLFRINNDRTLLALQKCSLASLTPPSGLREEVAERM